MKRKYFLKHLTMFTLPLLIPLIILGSLSIVITQQYVKRSINNSNAALLGQITDTIEMLSSDMDSLRISFNYDYSIVTKVRGILDQQSGYWGGVITFDMVNSILNAPANSKPYIHSIYVYYDNLNDLLISTTDGLIRRRQTADTDWFDSYAGDTAHETVWIEKRAIKRYRFEPQDTPVATIYGKLYSFSNSAPVGVIVLNIKLEYIEETLRSLATYAGQEILVLDEAGGVLCSNLGAGPSGDDLNRINEHQDGFFFADIGGEPCAVSKGKGAVGLTYVSIVRESVLYAVPLQLTKLIAGSLALSFALGLAVTMFFTRRSFQQLAVVIDIIATAEKGEPLPELPLKANNEYNYIIQNILKTFLEQSYLKLQLSEKQYRMQAMELKAMQAQINPHFLHNTLHSIYWEAFSVVPTPDKLTAMIDNLSRILVYSISAPHDQAPLGDEIRNTVAYTRIQQLRFADRFDVIWLCDESLSNVRVIKLLFQPLIENSVYHGFKDGGRKYAVKIRVDRRGDILRFAVIDNGGGITPERLSEIRGTLQSDRDLDAHIGLYNTDKRLKLTYGEGSGLTVRSRQGLGTVIRFSIPYTIEK